jgi:excisionase family DNA binding protein
MNEHTITSAEIHPAPAIEPLQVNVEEAARLLGLSRSIIYEMMRSGELPSTHRGAARRIPVAALREWIATHTEQRIERPSRR